MGVVPASRARSRSRRGFRPRPSAYDWRVDASSANPALAEALALVGDRWTLLIVAALLERPQRFGELQREVDGIAANVLTQRLRHLERHGLVIARPYSRRPPRFVYELSEAGRGLATPLRLLAGWGADHLGGGADPPDAGAPRHPACDTPMELRWWCPLCQEAVSDEALRAGSDEDVHFA